ncbi:MAG: hypothetical protein PF508_02745 [Spirochaeta sp.]|jgi:DNA repair exonuclease SbcCD ATPase subunit|nr:hypothetical protein [Spirochaeta sp.]
MGFTIGDIIVLLVVVVILAVYRQMDRNNRSLDKVKRFVERVQGEMDEIVAEKVTMLKDIGIEVDVHQKAAKEVLKRIYAVEEDLNSRTGSLEEIGTRLTEYEQALNQLVEMTRRTEENIERVRDESEYVDKVGKRIKTTQGKIEELEHSLPGIVSGFEQQNDERLGELEARIFASSEKRVSELANRIDGAGTRVQEFQEEVARLNGEAEEQSHQAREDLRDLHQQLVADARDELGGISQANREELHTQTQDIRTFIEDARREGSEFQAESERTIETLQESLAATVAEAEEELQRLAEQGRSMETEALATLRAHINNESSAVRDELTAEIDRLRAEETVRLEAFEQQLTGELTERIDSTRTALDGDIEHLVQTSRTEREAIESAFQALRTSVGEASAESERSVEDLTTRVAALDESIHSRVEDVRSALAAHAEDTDQRIDAERARFTAALAELRVSNENDRASVEEVSRELESAIGEVDRRLSEASGTTETRIAEMEEQLGARVDRTSREVETRVLGDLEKRLQDYETELNYRFTKIETVNGDIDQLEQHLRATMERISERVRGDFLSFGEELRELREQDRAEAETAMETLRGSMGELESGLNELKQRAYENVSEKLKVFEDEFFTDLRSRSDAMEAKISQWRTEVDERLVHLQEEHSSERAQLEQRYNEDLRGRLSQFQETITGQLNKTDEQIDSFRSGLQSRIDAAEEHITGFESSMQEELSALRDRSFQTFRQEFSQADTRVRDELKEFETEVEQRIVDIRGSVSSGTEELEGMISASRSDIAVWQTEVLNQLRSSSADVNNQLADTKVRISENMQELKREFNEEREELVEESHDERARIKNELTGLGGSVQKLEDRITDVSQHAVEEFEERYRGIRNSIDEHESAIVERLDDRSAEFRGLVDDTRGQFQAMRDKLLGKLEDEARTLETTLGEIDKRQKAFIEQTKIFERADTLKMALQDNIEELKNEITRVEGLRGEVREIEGQFTKIRKMSADAGEKMARFSADKRRIDLLEEDYKRLIGLAQSVEQKIEHVGNSDEQLQEITARLRSLDELQDEVESRFDRLEKRRGLIDQTVDSLEVNNRGLSDIETRMTELTQQIEAMPQQVQALSGQLKKVATARKETDHAVTQLANLEQTLADVESRMQELQTAREWLARTETRLEEIRRDAGEQVKLLGSLMREETRKNPVDGGAPSMNARETVQKLAHQGWNVDEIARATKVSKGEVELILELTGKK